MVQLYKGWHYQRLIHLGHLADQLKKHYLFYSYSHSFNPPVWLILILNFGVHSKLRNKLSFSENQEKTSLKLEIRKEQTNKQT